MWKHLRKSAFASDEQGIWCEKKATEVLRQVETWQNSYAASKKAHETIQILTRMKKSFIERRYNSGRMVKQTAMMVWRLRGGGHDYLQIFFMVWRSACVISLELYLAFS
jgi:hypothetical protein